MFFRDAESYNRSILREEKQGGRKDEIKKNFVDFPFCFNDVEHYAQCLCSRG